MAMEEGVYAVESGADLHRSVAQLAKAVVALEKRLGAANAPVDKAPSARGEQARLISCLWGACYSIILLVLLGVMALAAAYILPPLILNPKVTREVNCLVPPLHGNASATDVFLYRANETMILRGLIIYRLTTTWRTFDDRAWLPLKEYSSYKVWNQAMTDTDRLLNHSGTPDNATFCRGVYNLATERGCVERADVFEKSFVEVADAEAVLLPTLVAAWQPIVNVIVIVALSLTLYNIAIARHGIKADPFVGCLAVSLVCCYYEIEGSWDVVQTALINIPAALENARPSLMTLSIACLVYLFVWRRMERVVLGFASRFSVFLVYAALLLVPVFLTMYERTHFDGSKSGTYVDTEVVNFLFILRQPKKMIWFFVIRSLPSALSAPAYLVVLLLWLVPIWMQAGIPAVIGITSVTACLCGFGFHKMGEYSNEMLSLLLWGLPWTIVVVVASYVAVFLLFQAGGARKG